MVKGINSESNVNSTRPNYRTTKNLALTGGCFFAGAALGNYFAISDVRKNLAPRVTRDNKIYQINVDKYIESLKNTYSKSTLFKNFAKGMTLLVGIGLAIDFVKNRKAKKAAKAEAAKAAEEV